MTEKYSISELLNRMKANWPESVTPESEIILSLVRLNDLAVEKAKDNLLQFDLTQAGFEVLITLRALPHPRQLSPTELYKSILITSGGMTKVLKHLESKGWIERIDHEQDKRSKLVKLTKNGEILAQQSMAAVEQGDKQLLSQSLSTTELNNLRDILLNTVHKIETP